MPQNDAKKTNNQLVDGIHEMLMNDPDFIPPPNVTKDDAAWAEAWRRFRQNANNERALSMGDDTIEKQEPPRPGLVPQSGDWQHPDRWIRRDEPPPTKPTTKEPWQMTVDDFVRLYSGKGIESDQLANIHMGRVQQAVMEGKPIPLEVLADYPGLTTGKSNTIEKQEPPRPGLVPKSGDPQHPYRWVKPEEEKTKPSKPLKENLEIGDRFSYTPQAPKLDHPIAIYRIVRRYKGAYGENRYTVINEETGERRTGLLDSNFLNTPAIARLEKQQPPRPGLVPQSGDWQHPDRWIRRDEPTQIEPVTKEPWQMTIAERQAEIMRLKSTNRAAWATEGDLGPTQQARMSPKQHAHYMQLVQERLNMERQIEALSRNDKEWQSIFARRKERDIGNRTLQLKRHIEGLQRVGIGVSGKIKPRYQREIDKARAELESLQQFMSPEFFEKHYTPKPHEHGVKSALQRFTSAFKPEPPSFEQQQQEKRARELGYRWMVEKQVLDVQDGSEGKVPPKQGLPSKIPSNKPHFDEFEQRVDESNTKGQRPQTATERLKHWVDMNKMREGYTRNPLTNRQVKRKVGVRFP